MKVVTITGEKQCGLVEKPDPKARANIVVVKIHVTPMCTEYKAYKSGWKSESLGHEAAGEVIEVAQPCRVKVGDRVVVMPVDGCGVCPLCMDGEYIHCQHPIKVLEITGSEAGRATYAQKLIKSDWQLLPIPDGMSYEHASMACCGLGPTFGAMQLMEVNAYDTVVITGLGPVGLGGVMNGVVRGARVIGVEAHPYRAKLAKELGAAEVLDPNDKDVLAKLMALTRGVGVDKAVDCSGVASAQRLLIDAARRKGQVAFVGEAGELTIKVSDDMIRKGLRLHGAWHWNLSDAPRMFETIRRAGKLVDKVITHGFPMSRVKEAWELQLTGECGKVMLYPWE
jgi:L-iditol 2-dehydrogenase